MSALLWWRPLLVAEAILLEVDATTVLKYIEDARTTNLMMMWLEALKIH